MKIFGHRGARGLLAENTLAAIDKAIALGIDGIEVDTQLTADRVVVLHHDYRLNPGTTRDGDGAWVVEPGPRIVATPFAALQAYDVGRRDRESDYGRLFPEQAPCDGSRIPSLRQALDRLCAPDGRHLTINVEIKSHPERPQVTAPRDEVVAAHVALVREFALEDRVVLQSFDWQLLADIRRAAPEIKLACISVEADWLDNIRGQGNASRPWTAGLDIADFDGSVPGLVQAMGAGTWSAYHENLDRRRIAEAHALGLKVMAWTVNEVEVMARLAGEGVDAIITDYPDRARQTFGR